MNVNQHGRRLRPLLPWLVPGIGVKRWLFLVVGGVVGLSGGLASLLWRVLPQSGGQIGALWYVSTLQFIPTPWHQFTYMALGGTCMAIGLYGAIRSIVIPLRTASDERPIGRVLEEHWQALRGPRVVLLGSGPAFAQLLRMLSPRCTDITAVLQLRTDDVGLSARELNHRYAFVDCLLALARDELALRRLFAYEFPSGPREGLRFGDDFLETLIASRPTVTDGLAAAMDVLSLRGELMVAPAAGQLDARESEPIILRLLDADLIVLGPNSLITESGRVLNSFQLDRALRLSGAVKVHLAAAPDADQWESLLAAAGISPVAGGANWTSPDEREDTSGPANAILQTYLDVTARRARQVVR